MRSYLRRLISLLDFGSLALFIIGAGGALWGSLIYSNLQMAPSIPWCLPAICVFLWLEWQYLSGRGWPATTSFKRRVLLRANRVSLAAYGWSTLAGLLAMISLAGLWIVMFRIIPMQPNLFLPGRFTSSPLFRTAIIVGASLLAPITEEAAIRGYLQSVLEREFPAITAVLLSSAVFALAHVTQGVAWPKLLFYFLVGIAFGSLALLNDSILPVIPVHIAGDLIFFFFVWANDYTRTVVWQHGPDWWFWLHVAQTLGFAAAAVLVFRRVRQVRKAVDARGSTAIFSPHTAVAR
jgi:membrane protease YdiL (CAAX protease family)